MRKYLFLITVVLFGLFLSCSQPASDDPVLFSFQTMIEKRAGNATFVAWKPAAADSWIKLEGTSGLYQFEVPSDDTRFEVLAINVNSDGDPECYIYAVTCDEAESLNHYFNFGDGPDDPAEMTIGMPLTLGGETLVSRDMYVVYDEFRKGYGLGPETTTTCELYGTGTFDIFSKAVADDSDVFYAVRRGCSASDGDSLILTESEYIQADDTVTIDISSVSDKISFRSYYLLEGRISSQSSSMIVVNETDTNVWETVCVPDTLRSDGDLYRLLVRCGSKNIIQHRHILQNTTVSAFPQDARWSDYLFEKTDNGFTITCPEYNPGLAGQATYLYQFSKGMAETNYILSKDFLDNTDDRKYVFTFPSGTDGWNSEWEDVFSAYDEITFIGSDSGLLSILHPEDGTDVFQYSLEEG